MSPDYFMTTKMERWRLVNALVAYDEFYENKTFLELCTQMIADVKNYSEKRNNMGKTIETITKQIETLKKLKCLNNKSQQETTEPLSKPFNSFSSNGSIRIGRQQQFNTNYESIKIGRQQINIKTNHGAGNKRKPQELAGSSKKRQNTQEGDNHGSLSNQPIEDRNNNDSNVNDEGNKESNSCNDLNNQFPAGEEDDNGAVDQGSDSVGIQPGLVTEEDNNNKVHDGSEARNESTLELARWIRSFISMSQAERLEHLYRSHGSDNHLDLMTAKWSKRKHDIIKEYLKALKFEYAVTNEEAGCLAKLRCCKNREDLVSLKTDLFKHREVSAGIEFIRTAIHHIILFWKNNKNVLNNLEDWWRIFLYGPVFDSAFSSAQEYNIIRSESESQAYKAYCILFKDVLPPGEKQKMDKVDMIVRTADHQFDIFSAEDKPLSATRKSVQDMIAKNQARRVITLDVIEKQLPRPELISYFENFTAIWHGNLMRLHCTRKINGRFYHYEAASTHVPLSPENYEGIARLLLIVLSLKRHVIYNHKLLTVIANQQSKNAIDDDNRSPLPTEEQDDSVEYNQDFIEKLKEELDKEAADKRQKHTTQYQEAVEALSLADEEGTVLTTKLSEIFNNSNIDEQLQNSDKYEPSYNMYEDESFVYVYVDLPGVDIKQIKITGSSSGILSISGTRKNMNVPGSCLHQGSFSDFQRNIMIDQDVVDLKKTVYTIDSGLLILKVPKEESTFIVL